MYGEGVSITFYPVRSYQAARGPCFDEDAPSPRYKLCLVATDLQYLISFLERAVTRPDGYYVKYAPEAKDGMYLGRVFLDDDEALGQLWSEVKKDDKLLASVQDDHFIQTFRSESSLAAARATGK
jgi:hypothetical protein